MNFYFLFLLSLGFPGDDQILKEYWYSKNYWKLIKFKQSLLKEINKIKTWTRKQENSCHTILWKCMIESTDEVLVKSKPIHFWLIEQSNEGKILQAF